MGRLVTDQQLNEMTTQLSAAQNATAEAQARYLRIKHVIDTHQMDAAVAKSLTSLVSSTLRTQYAEASKRYSELSAKLPADHVVLVNLRKSIDEISKLLFEEFARVADSYKNDYEIAAAREKSLTESLESKQQISVSNNDELAQLRQLEQKAESYRTIYQSYLQRYQEVVQQQNFPMTDEHVMSEAAPPTFPSHPRMALVLVISTGLGIYSPPALEYSAN